MIKHLNLLKNIVFKRLPIRKFNDLKTKESEAERILNRCIEASYEITHYHEELSRDGMAEVLIFCICVALHREKNAQVIEDVLIMLIRFIAEDSDEPKDIDMIAKHVTMRTEDYATIIKDIARNPSSFDLKPLYCAFYRYPLTDVHWAVAEPKYAENFRGVVLKILDMLLIDKN